MDTWMRRLTFSARFGSDPQLRATANRVLSESLRHAEAMESAMRQVAALLNTTPEESRVLIERVRSLYPVFTVSDAKRHVLREYLEGRVPETLADWATRELARPHGSAHHRTVTVMGKPYHWRQDYTGQLKLAAGESPW